MNSIKVLIVEDEILIAETIEMFLKERGHSVTDIAISYEEAVESFKTNLPDVVLLDVRLYGEKSGIDFANYLNEKQQITPFVFLTSQFDTRIVHKAMATKPLGYLAKPIHKESLWTTTELAYQHNLSKQTTEAKLHFHDGVNTHLIDANDILYIKSEHVYLKLFLKNAKPIVIRKSLKKIINNIDQNNFLQCHRGYIININHVESFSLNGLIINNDEIPISKTYKKRVLEKLELSESELIKVN